MHFKSSRTVEKELKALVNSRENGNRCGECFATYPTWCSINLGVFLCGRCASLHRKVLNGDNGSVQSYVKSLTLDRWTAEDLEEISHSGGNQRNNAVWNPRKQWFPHDADTNKAHAEEYIRRKYVMGAFKSGTVMSSTDDGRQELSVHRYGEGSFGSQEFRNTSNTVSRSSTDGYSPSGTAGTATGSNIPDLTNRTVTDTEIGRYYSKMATMKNLGYTNTNKTAEALILANGDINLALDILEKDAKKASPPAPQLPKRSSASPKPQPAVFDGYTGAVAAAPVPAVVAQPVPDPQLPALSTGVQQYIDPTTGQIYVDQTQYLYAAQQQQLQQQLQQQQLQQQQLQQQQLQQQQLQQQQLQQQQLLLQQQQPLHLQQTASLQGINKNAIMSLYDRQDLYPASDQAQNPHFQHTQLNHAPQQPPQGQYQPPQPPTGYPGIGYHYPT